MRFEVSVSSSLPELAWSEVHGPVRAVLYGLIGEQDADLAKELHDHGWGGSSLRPLGASPPLFTGGKKRKGVYAATDQGAVWLGSPVPRIAGCLLAALAGRKELRWGRARFAIKGVRLDAPVDHSSGEAIFASVSPVLVKKDGRFLLPGEDGFEDGLTHNLRHKADLLGLPNEVRIEVKEAGPRRRFDVQGAMRTGATVTLHVEAAPALLDALRAWGIGLGTNQGFGWIR